MKRWNPLLVFLISSILYWIGLYIVAITIDSQHSGGEQYFLTIFVKGIDLFPIVGMILFVIICLIYRTWAIRNKLLSIILLTHLLVASIFMLYYNH